jgi:anhydro-N-acetylmuramic acid kinase
MLGNEQVSVAGTMSGTSLDGVDAAEITTDGETIIAFGHSTYRAYSAQERAVLQQGLGQWPDTLDPSISELVETAHVHVLQDFPDVDLIGFHGQTFAHDPQARGTHQAGDGAILAELLGLPVVWDFRTADVDLGGQGAPLAPFFHFALAKWIDAKAPLAFLNLGGVGNITWVDPRFDKPEQAGALLAFDTGPANAPLNDLMMARTGQPLDQDGALAATGNVDEAVITQFLKDPYFYKTPPKSLDRDAFSGLQDAVAELSDADAAATLTAAIALSVSQALSLCPSQPSRILVAGGGRKNQTLMQMLAATLPCDVQVVEDEGLDGDMLEAQAFAYLAVRVLRGLPTSCPSTTGVKAAVSGGTVSRPQGVNLKITP